MKIEESLLVAGLGMVVVMAALCILALLIVLFSKVVVLTTKSSAASAVAAAPAAQPAAAPLVSGAALGVAPGSVSLNHVSEKNAAMIMAIVSDESKIPLEELVFKSIRGVE